MIRQLSVGLLVAGLLAGCSAILGLGDGTIAGSHDGGPPPSGGDDSTTSSSSDALGGKGGDDSAVASGDATGGVGDSSQSAPPPVCDGGPGTCVTFAPSGGIPVADLSGAGLAAFALTIHDAGGGEGGAPGDTVVNVDTGEITGGGGVIRPATTGDPSVRDVQAGIAYRQTDNNIAVFTFGSLAVPAGTTFKLIGTRAVAIASSTTVTIDGVIEVRPMSPSGSDICGLLQAVAPGGYAGGAGEIQGHQGGNTASTPGGGAGGGGGTAAPGGGGGHASGGAAGCDPSAGSGCGSAGVSYDLATLDTTSFHGGAGGGGGGAVLGPYHAGPSGGNGGGAIRIIAATSLEVSGRIDASGCGGLAGSATSQCPVGMPLQDCPSGSTITAGGGGGAGGAIVLEGPRLELQATAVLYAMGGAGGSPIAPGGSSEGNNGCEEGVPGDTHAAAGAGSPANLQYDAGSQIGIFPSCGGGGGFGWIRLNAGGGNVAMAAAATLNPPLVSGKTTIGALSP